MSEQTYKIICLLLITFYAIVRAPYQWRYRPGRKKTRLFHFRESILIAFVTVCWWGSSAVFIFSTVLDFATFEWAPVVRLGGACVMLAGILYFWRVHHFLGSHWSPALELSETHALVDTGPYRRIRHPMYTAIWISILGQSILCANWMLALAAGGSFLTLCLIRIPDEERMLASELGEQYVDYMRRTGRILPRLR
jgi:protein-S-isoprenylcysteine O-methyltransferase Ste14